MVAKEKTEKDQSVSRREGRSSHHLPPSLPPTTPHTHNSLHPLLASPSQDKTTCKAPPPSSLLRLPHLGQRSTNSPARAPVTPSTSRLPTRPRPIALTSTMARILPANTDPESPEMIRLAIAALFDDCEFAHDTSSS